MDSDDTARMRRILGHRLLNISSGIKTASGYLASQLDERLTPMEREYFPLIQKQCDEVSVIVSRMNLLFGKLERSQPVPLAEALNAAFLAIRADFPDVPLECELPEGMTRNHVLCPNTVAVALREAVSNARLASTEPVTIEVEIRSGQCVLRVIDRGASLDDAAAGQVFDVFYTTRAQAIGLGLSIARRLVLEQGGAVSFCGVPEGNCVEFVVPLQARELNQGEQNG